MEPLIFTLSVSALFFIIYHSTTGKRGSLQHVFENERYLQLAFGLIPVINLMELSILVNNLLTGRIYFKPEMKNTVYFLPLLSLGLLYFI